MNTSEKLSKIDNVRYGECFTIEIVLHQFKLPTDIKSYGPCLPWLTLFAAGETPESTIWTEPSPMTGVANQPTLRIGFTRKDRFLAAELVDLGQPSPVRITCGTKAPDNETLQIALLVNSKDGYARLLVDSKPAASDVTVTPSAKICQLSTVYCGSGTNVPAVYFRVWRRCLTPEELCNVRCHEVPCDWDDSFFHPNLNLDIAVSNSKEIAWQSVERKQRGKLTSFADQLADRVLNSKDPSEATNSLGADEKRKIAAQTLDDVTATLQDLLALEETIEPDLLNFFAETPAAAFLLTPMLKRQWREILLQDFGQIDFVTETVAGRYLAIEIESPKHTLFTKKGEITRPVHHAIDQVEKWTRGIPKSSHISNKYFGCADQERFDRLVVIGRSKCLSDDDRISRWSSWSRKGTELRTWDDVARLGTELVKRLKNPKIDDYQWEL